jgi:hypothetical protein
MKGNARDEGLKCMSMTWQVCMRLLICSTIRSTRWLHCRASIAELADLV